MLLLAIVTLGAWAQSARGDANRGWYLGGGGGIAVLDVEESVNPKPDPGLRLAATGGFRFNRNLSIEFDTGYIRNTFTRSRVVSRREETLQQVPLVVNGLYAFANETPFEAFAGAGIGVSYERMGDSDGGDACLSFKGGVRYEVGERLDLGADYTFFMLGFLSAFIGEAVGVDTYNLTLRWKY